jgi:hypothetical protein
MTDVVKKTAYFVLEVADKPGEAARILRILSEAGVNLLAFSGFPRGRRAQLDFIPEDVKAFRKAMTRAKIKLQPKKLGFVVHGEDRPGAVAEVMQRLADAKLNVTAVDAVSAGAGRYGAILWVKPKDLPRASRVLKAL